MSSGGFLVVSAVPFPIGQIRQLAFTAAETGWTSVLSARVAYSHLRADEDPASPAYVTGYAFVDPARPEIEQAIDMLLAYVTDVLTVE